MIDLNLSRLHCVKFKPSVCKDLLVYICMCVYILYKTVYIYIIKLCIYKRVFKVWQWRWLCNGGVVYSRKWRWWWCGRRDELVEVSLSLSLSFFFARTHHKFSLGGGVIVFGCRNELAVWVFGRRWTVDGGWILFFFVFSYI